jgi:hypothetical protein
MNMKRSINQVISNMAPSFVDLGLLKRDKNKTPQEKPAMIQEWKKTDGSANVTIKVN